MPFAKAASRCLRGIVAATAAGLGVLAPVPLAAQGDLLIAPTRLVLDGRRGGEVILSNIGSEEATYRVTLELRRMSPDGELQPIEESDANPTEKAALEMVRYAPRRVTLPPNEPQAIRISARPGEELPDGEYRVHMSFAAVPKVAPVVAPAAAPSTSRGGLAINLTPIYGITMPVIVRKGQLDATGSLASPTLAQGPDGPEFSLDIVRSGAASIYGDLYVFPQGRSEAVFIIRGIGVYPEISSRHTTFNITPEQAAAMRGPVRIELRNPPQTGDSSLIASLDAVLR